MFNGEDTARAGELLASYIRGKEQTDLRLTADAEFFREGFLPAPPGRPRRTAWLFNSVMSKHADIRADIPACSVLPLSRESEKAARLLDGLLPATLDENHFARRYSDAALTKLISGTAVWSVIWDPSAHGGEGGVRLGNPDLRSVFWEPGVTDINDSPCLFVTASADPARLAAEFPHADRERFTGAPFIGEYSSASDGKVVIADMYAREKNSAGQNILVFRKFCGSALLYDSSADPALAQRGYCDHGRYPIVLDRLFPDSGSPAGFGYVDLMGGVQTDIDLLTDAMIANVRETSHRRYFCRVGGGVNEEEFADWQRDFVHVGNSFLGEDSIREIHTEPLPSQCLELLRDRISELKETSFNRDYSQGGTSSGVTSGTAISALQQAGQKASDDFINGTREAMKEVFGLICALTIQFVRGRRSLRTVNEDGACSFTDIDAAAAFAGQPAVDCKIKSAAGNASAPAAAERR